jgi:hypothetical protein
MIQGWLRECLNSKVLGHKDNLSRDRCLHYKLKSDRLILGRLILKFNMLPKDLHLLYFLPSLSQRDFKNDLRMVRQAQQDRWLLPTQLSKDLCLLV